MDEQPDLTDIFVTDFSGEKCITEEGLDWVWPTDDREPLDIGGKGLFLPPTCTEHQKPCHEMYGQEYCLKAAFDGPPPLPTVPLPPSMFMLGAAIVGAALWKKYA